MNLPASVVVQQSDVFSTNAGIVHGPEGALLVDPGITPGELLRIADQAGTIAAGFTTHAHWDHMLWHEAFGTAVPRFASAETVAYMETFRDRILARFDAVETDYGDGPVWDRSLFFQEQPMPWGPGEIAGIPVELIAARGHLDGQAALFLPEQQVLFAGDTLSDIEVPSLSGGLQSLREYQVSLDRLQSVIDRANVLVPGHGAIGDRAEAQRRLDADRRYLEALAHVVDADSVRTDSEEVAYSILHETGEDRATPELSWGMHLRNVQALQNERKAATEGSLHRQSARLLLINPNGQVWMLRIDDPVRPRWIVPGGGLEAGEGWEDAARRELGEECGLHDTELGPCVAERRAIDHFGDTPFSSDAKYFLVRTHDQVPTGANMSAHEAAHYDQQRWWSADDIRISHETVFPIGLADLLDAINRGEVPESPVTLID